MLFGVSGLLLLLTPLFPFFCKFSPGQYERAASIYIQTKNFTAAAPLMAKVSSSKLQLQFAKAKEAEGR